MATRRDALVAAGLAKAGRGKFSKDALAWLDKERAKGVKFDDDETTVKPVKATGGSVAVEGKTVVGNSVGYPDYIFPSDFRFPEEEYKAVELKDGKKVVHGMREVCNNCRVSLVNHSCDTPIIYGSISVKIERR